MHSNVKKQLLFKSNQRIQTHEIQRQMQKGIKLKIVDQSTRLYNLAFPAPPDEAVQQAPLLGASG